MTIPLHTLMQTIITFHLVLLSLLTDLTVRCLPHTQFYGEQHTWMVWDWENKTKQNSWAHTTVWRLQGLGEGGRSKRAHGGKWWRKIILNIKDNTFYVISMQKNIHNQWLPASFRIKPRLVAITYKALHCFYSVIHIL